MNRKFQKVLRFIKNLILVPRCASCNLRLSPIPEREDVTYGKICFCEKCREKWLVAKAEICPTCYNLSEKCNCTPDFFFKYQPDIPSLCFYRPASGDTPSRAIITMKRRLDVELFEFMAIELRPKLEKTLGKMGINGRDCVFTWMPRKRDALVKNGFDQGRELSVRLAALFGAECRPLFIRTGKKEQKKLDKGSRKSNAEKHFKLNRSMKGFSPALRSKGLNAFLKDKNVVIVDDVLTSGATLRRGVELLSPTGVKNTVVACIAKSVNVKTSPK